MNLVFTAAILGILVQNPTTYLRLQAAPIEPAPTHFSQVGLAVFDILVNHAGFVVKDVTLYGQPPFIERPRLSIDAWQFEPGPRDEVHVNATFLFKPKLNLPDSTSILDIPLPDPNNELRSPFPVKIVDPGYPIGGAATGTVVMQVTITPEGGVGNIKILTAVPTLTEAAVTAVRDWKFHMPLDLDRLSQTAVVAIYFNEPKLDAGAVIPDVNNIATLVNSTALAAPVGAEGIVRTDDPNGLVFVYGDSHWVVPFALVSGIELTEISSQQSLLKITFSGAQTGETIDFHLQRQAALSIVSALSARTGKMIHFKGPLS